ncbi:hypothetical protein [Lactobacillus sp. PSON]|uniref:hypothetical protein n=1 Tax=Lactobacillus sp. PSON TaxID=3455454 RepID=UPI004042DCA1
MSEVKDYIEKRRDRSNEKRQEFITKMKELEKLNLKRDELVAKMKKEFGDKFTDAEMEELLRK